MQIDNEYRRQQDWAERILGLPRLKRIPSEYAREHVYWGFNRNPTGARIARREIGVDKVMWANDFPPSGIGLADLPHRRLQPGARSLPRDERQVIPIS